jgi:site-specific DNA recombinase
MRTAAYARYSTDMQREASLEDQLRNIRQRCAREGWRSLWCTATRRSAARAAIGRAFASCSRRCTHRFDALLVDDLSRLSRDKDDTGKAIKRLTFAGVRVVGVSDGTDTSRDGYELDTGIRAVIGEHYLRDLAKKTHRGLTGRALSGASAGGLPYGYRVAGVGRRDRR